MCTGQDVARPAVGEERGQSDASNDFRRQAILEEFKVELLGQHQLAAVITKCIGLVAADHFACNQTFLPAHLQF